MEICNGELEIYGSGIGCYKMSDGSHECCLAGIPISI